MNQDQQEIFWGTLGRIRHLAIETDADQRIAQGLRDVIDQCFGKEQEAQQ